MGTFISAFISAVTNDNNNNNNNSTSNDKMDVKSKSKQSVHSPNASNKNKIHEFIWKYGGKEVLLAGNFTDWKPSIKMVPCDRDKEYWRGLVELDSGLEWQFKFVVDGVWRCSLDLPTTTDPQGNTNNIIYPE